MKRLLLLLLFISFGFPEICHAQNDTIQTIDAAKQMSENDDEIFVIVEKMPSWKGCENIDDTKEMNECTYSGVMKHLIQNLKYPATAKDAGIQGTVYVNFEVMSNGKVDNVRILRGIGGGCDEEAKRVVEMFPDFNPGTQKGKPVRVSYNLPIKFNLTKGNDKKDKKKE